MPQLFKLRNPDSDNTQFYARDPTHIIELVEHYRMTKLTPAQREHPPGDLYGWVRKSPSLEDIEPVAHGGLVFQAGLVVLDGEGEFFRHIQVLDDFTVDVNDESLPYFEMARRHILNTRRCNLYKFSTPGMFGTQNFLPEDVARAIAGYDITPYLQMAKERLDKVQSLKHPGLHVGFKENPDRPIPKLPVN